MEPNIHKLTEASVGDPRFPPSDQTQQQKPHRPNVNVKKTILEKEFLEGKRRRIHMRDTFRKSKKDHQFSMKRKQYTDVRNKNLSLTTNNSNVNSITIEHNTLSSLESSKTYSIENMQNQFNMKPTNLKLHNVAYLSKGVNSKTNLKLLTPSNTPTQTPQYAHFGRLEGGTTVIQSLNLNMNSSEGTQGEGGGLESNIQGEINLCLETISALISKKQTEDMTTLDDSDKTFRQSKTKNSNLQEVELDRLQDDQGNYNDNNNSNCLNILRGSEIQQELLLSLLISLREYTCNDELSQTTNDLLLNHEGSVFKKLTALFSDPDIEDNIKLEITWICTNIAAETSEYVEALLFLIPDICKYILPSENIYLQEQACWLVGNLADESMYTKSLLIKEGALQFLVNLLQGYVNSRIDFSSPASTKNSSTPGMTVFDDNIFRVAAWAISNIAKANTSDANNSPLFNGGTTPYGASGIYSNESLDLVPSAKPFYEVGLFPVLIAILEKEVMSEHPLEIPSVLMEILWIINFLTEREQEYVQLLIEENLLLYLTALLERKVCNQLGNTCVIDEMEESVESMDKVIPMRHEKGNHDIAADYCRPLLRCFNNIISNSKAYNQEDYKNPQNQLRPSNKQTYNWDIQLLTQYPSFLTVVGFLLSEEITSMYRFILKDVLYMISNLLADPQGREHLARTNVNVLSFPNPEPELTITCNIPMRCVEIFLSHRMFDIQIDGIYIIWNLMSAEGTFVIDTIHKYPEIIQEIIHFLTYRDMEATHVVVCIVHQCFSLDFEFVVPLLEECDGFEALENLLYFDGVSSGTQKQVNGILNTYYDSLGPGEDLQFEDSEEQQDIQNRNAGFSFASTSSMHNSVNASFNFGDGHGSYSNTTLVNQYTEGGEGQSSESGLTSGRGIGRGRGRGAMINQPAWMKNL